MDDSGFTTLSPIVFNPLKHHRNFILQFLNEANPAQLEALLENICNNYIDIYTGLLSPHEISLAVINRLQSEKVFLQEDFNPWLSSSRNFHHIRLADNSEWIVRKGETPDRYIHIHPAKTGEHTMRFKGSTLKTVYKLKKVLNNSNKTSLSTELVNKVRKEVSLSPVKKLEKGKGILKCWNTFFK